jgi:uncharacterized protein YjbI with pentapeptide repeats
MNKALPFIFSLTCLLLGLANTSKAQCHNPLAGQHLSRNMLIKLIQTKQDKPLNLCGTHLNQVDLSGLDLSYANLAQTDLTSAKLSRTNLSHAKLDRAFLRWADCRQANLSYASLKRAKLQESNLQQANLYQANLELADLSGAKLQHANLDVVHAKYANFGFSDLLAASLVSAYLYRTNFEEANLSQVNLKSAVLENASFNNANAAYANFSDTNLRHATFINTHLKEANFFQADLYQATYQPKLGALPELVLLATTKHFRSLKFNTMIGVSGLAELRAAYSELGMRYMERSLSAMLKIADMREAWLQGGFGWVEAALSYGFFYLTCDFGAAPNRPLQIFLISIALFVLPYLFALAMPSRHSGLFVTWKSGRFLAWDKVARQSRQKHLIHRLKYRPTNSRAKLFLELFRVFRIACFFSLISSFQIGWSDLNLSTWISRMQTREYILSSNGWVRVVAGLQSLLSAYLVVLWAICYFGRPFQW